MNVRAQVLCEYREVLLGSRSETENCLAALGCSENFSQWILCVSVTLFPKTVEAANWKVISTIFASRKANDFV